MVGLEMQAAASDRCEPISRGAASTSITCSLEGWRVSGLSLSIAHRTLFAQKRPDLAEVALKGRPILPWGSVRLQSIRQHPARIAVRLLPTRNMA